MWIKNQNKTDPRGRRAAPSSNDLITADMNPRHATIIVAEMAPPIRNINPERQPHATEMMGIPTTVAISTLRNARSNTSFRCSSRNSIHSFIWDRTTRKM
jgi:hypothetical protein